MFVVCRHLDGVMIECSLERLIETVNTQMSWSLVRLAVKHGTLIRLSTWKGRRVSPCLHLEKDGTWTINS